MSSKDIPSESKINCTLCPSKKRLRAMREHYGEKHEKGVLTVKCTIQDEEGSCFWNWFCANTFECFIEHVRKDHPNFKIDGCSTQFKPENGFEFVEYKIDYVEHSKICCVIKELHEDHASMKRDALRRTKKLASTINRVNKKRKISEVDKSKNQMKPKKKITKRSPIKNIKGFCSDIIMDLVDVFVDAIDPVDDFDEDVEDFDEDVEDFDEDVEDFEIVKEIITLEPDDEIKPELVDKTEVIEIIDEDEEIKVIESDDAIEPVVVIPSVVDDEPSQLVLNPFFDI